MTLPVVYRPKVGRDLAEGHTYYEARSEGLGERFVAEVDFVFDSIERQPGIYARVHGEVRRAVVSKFPYAIFYRIEPKRVVVLAVVHTARNPRLWPGSQSSRQKPI